MTAQVNRPLSMVRGEIHSRRRRHKSSESRLHGPLSLASVVPPLPLPPTVPDLQSKEATAETTSAASNCSSLQPQWRKNYAIHLVIASALSCREEMISDSFQILLALFMLSIASFCADRNWKSRDLNSAVPVAERQDGNLVCWIAVFIFLAVIDSAFWRWTFA